MRVILDTNVLISALLTPFGATGAVYRSWTEGGFILLVTTEQLTELRQTLQKPALAARIRPHRAGHLINLLRRVAEEVGPLPKVERSPDPSDDFLLAMAEAGGADYLVTGDHSGLLTLVRHAGTRIVSVREFAELLNLS